MPILLYLATSKGNNPVLNGIENHSSKTIYEIVSAYFLLIFYFARNFCTCSNGAKGDANARFRR